MVVQYFNYRKEQYFKVLSTFLTRKQHTKRLNVILVNFSLIQKTEDMQKIEDQNEWLVLPGRLILYTVNSGYDEHEHVIAVVKAPAPVPGNAGSIS